MSSATRLLGLAPVAPAALRWQAGPLVFQLDSSHPLVLDRARTVLGPWLNGSTNSHSQMVRFLVEPDGGSRWRVERVGNGEAKSVESIDLAIAVVEYSVVAELLAPGRGVVSLHAALLSRRSRGVILVGPKESGKSTLACALLGAGWRLHSDDTTLIEPGPRARGIPRRVSLRVSSLHLIGAATWRRILDLPGTTATSSGLLFHPLEAWPGKAPTSVEPSAVIFLGRRGTKAEPARIESLDAARALIALAPYSNRCDAGLGSALEALQPLADRVPTFDLGRGDLRAMVERVSQVVSS